MVFTITIRGYDGEPKEFIRHDGDRATIARLLADYPGAASALVVDAIGRSYELGKGAAFVLVDGPARRKAPVARDVRRTYNGTKVRNARAWYGAALVA